MYVIYLAGPTCAATLPNRLPVPLLMVAGDQGIPARIVDSETVAGARPRAPLILPPATNPLLKAPSGGGAANLPTNSDQVRWLAPGPADKMMSFIEAAIP